jgi:uncharacterized protein (TIGR03084 family)
MPVDLHRLVDDLAAETAALTELTDPLDDAGWRRGTPAIGWTVADQIGHLAYFDDAAIISAREPDRFRADLAMMLAQGGVDPDEIAARYRRLDPAAVRDWFAEGRTRLIEVFRVLDPAARVPWYGPDMSVASALTARLMETWAHGQDIADALGADRTPTDRLRHVAHIGVGARAFSFTAHGRPVPTAPVFVDLLAPSEDRWTWGPPEAADRISGSALDFCLLVTQRRHRDDTSLTILGPAATEWMKIAQAFAGPPGAGRAPGQFGR